MSSSSAMFVGIDASGGRQPFTFAALDPDRRLVALSSAELEGAISCLEVGPGLHVAVNAPPRPNLGIVRKRLEKQNVSTGRLRGSDVRLAEHELRERGISVSPTAARPERCATWIQAGFELYQRLGKLGVKAFPSPPEKGQWLEVNPHAAFTVLLGQLPLPKPTLEGRLQRQLVLHDRGVGVRDPMGFFEEITRHKLLRGILPMELVYLPEELDALVAAYTALLAATEPQTLTALGDRHEGQIYLPTSELQPRYT
jgi:predicted nuclease with RNAse H fold